MYLSSLPGKSRSGLSRSEIREMKKQVFGIGSVQPILVRDRSQPVSRIPGPAAREHRERYVPGSIGALRKTLPRDAYCCRLLRVARDSAGAPRTRLCGPLPTFADRARPNEAAQSRYAKRRSPNVPSLAGILLDLLNRILRFFVEYTHNGTTGRAVSKPYSP